MRDPIQVGKQRKVATTVARLDLADLAVEKRQHSYRRGHDGEQTVANQYIAQGGIVLAQRYRCPHGELDLVVRMPDALVFVEVKWRAAATADVADVMPGVRNQRRVWAAALHYIAAHPQQCALGLSESMRVDLAVITGISMVIYPNAWVGDIQ